VLRLQKVRGMQLLTNRGMQLRTILPAMWCCRFETVRQEALAHKDGHLPYLHSAGTAMRCFFGHGLEMQWPPNATKAVNVQKPTEQKKQTSRDLQWAPKLRMHRVRLTMASHSSRRCCARAEALNPNCSEKAPDASQCGRRCGNVLPPTVVFQLLERRKQME